MTDPPTVALPEGQPVRVIAGRYELESLCGRGGSAEVWAATDNALGRRVAVKLVTASGGEDSARVGDEARLLARLSHPGLVPVYDAGTDEAGRPWVVMELVEGETLADVVRRGPIPSVRTADIGQTLALALDHVHAQGLVHRDVKPANVLLARDGRVRLTDFGIARLVDAARVTATGMAVGTASFLAPEQVTGSAVGPPADVYALGLVLLECVTGRREYPGNAVEVALARLHRPPEVPDDLPAGWPALLRAATDLEPERRPTAAELAGQLGVIASGGSATALLAVGSDAAGPLADAEDRTQVFDRTAVLDRPVGPRPVVSRPPASRPAGTRPLVARPAIPASRRRPAGLWAVLATVATVVVVGVVLALSRGGGTPAPPAIDNGVPAPLRSDLVQLEHAVPK